MPLNLVVPGADPRDRLRVEVDLNDGRTNVWSGPAWVGSAWFCPPSRWEGVQPDSPPLNSALIHAARVLETLDIEPVEAHSSCEEGNRCDLTG